MNSITHPIPTFSILESGKRKETLIHCFLERVLQSVDPENLPLSVKAKNGEVYSIIWDFPLPKQKEYIHTIISFQKHTYGNYAIVRPVRTGLEADKPAEITFLSSYVGV